MAPYFNTYQFQRFAAFFSLIHGVFTLRGILYMSLLSQIDQQNLGIGQYQLPYRKWNCNDPLSFIQTLFLNFLPLTKDMSVVFSNNMVF